MKQKYEVLNVEDISWSFGNKYNLLNFNAIEIPVSK